MTGAQNGAPPIVATLAPTPAPHRPATPHLVPPRPAPPYPSNPSRPSYNRNYICNNIRKPDAMAMLGDGLTYGFYGKSFVIYSSKHC